MTQEEKDAVVGRVLRESREAEGELSQLLVKAEQMAKDLEAVAKAITERAYRAKLAGAVVVVVERGRREEIAQDHPLSNSLPFHTPDAIRELDREITTVSARVAGLRQQTRTLNI
jgi:hypothetical protein